MPVALNTLVNRLKMFKIQNKAGIFIVHGEKMELAAHLGHPEFFLKMHDNMTVYDCLCGLAARSGELVISTNSSDVCPQCETQTVTSPIKGLTYTKHVCPHCKTVETDASKTSAAMATYTSMDIETVHVCEHCESVVTPCPACSKK